MKASRMSALSTKSRRCLMAAILPLHKVCCLVICDGGTWASRAVRVQSRKAGLNAGPCNHPQAGLQRSAALTYL
jgi:hypothetical protein